MTVYVREKPQQTADLELEWQVAPGASGKPALVSLAPGGSLTLEDRALLGTADTASASLTAANLLAPADDLGFRVEWRRPGIRGPGDPKAAALSLAAFNSRRLSPVFTPGPGGDEVPPIFLDRVGAKLALTERYSRGSHGSFGVVLEHVAARDEAGELAPAGTRQLASGMLAPAGPPTTLSGTGTDVNAYLQAALVRDTTWSSRGQTLGARDTVTVEQGLPGLGTARAGAYNRATLSATRFLRLPLPLPAAQVVAGEPLPSPPASLVLHARGGAALGDLPTYAAFPLGGPHSVRGYSLGELGVARRFAEAAVEARVPVKGATAFAFAEWASDLGSSGSVPGDPTGFYRRPGSGASLGAGVKAGAVRLEYATDANTGAGAAWVRFGERF